MYVDNNSNLIFYVIHTDMLVRGASGSGKWKLGGEIMWKVEIRGMT